MPDRVTQDDHGQLVVTRPLMDEIQGLRSDVSAGFAGLTARLEGKADKADVARMEARLDEHGTQIAELRQWRHDRETAAGVTARRLDRVLTRRQKVWGIVGAVALVAATAMSGVLASLFTGH